MGNRWKFRDLTYSVLLLVHLISLGEMDTTDTEKTVQHLHFTLVTHFHSHSKLLNMYLKPGNIFIQSLKPIGKTNNVNCMLTSLETALVETFSIFSPRNSSIYLVWCFSNDMLQFFSFWIVSQLALAACHCKDALHFEFTYAWKHWLNSVEPKNLRKLFIVSRVP